MDIGYLTFWGAKSGESITEGYAANLEEVAAADEIGMDSVWVGGVPLGGIQPLQIAPAIAARTRRIRIGTAVHLPHLRAPDEKFETEVTEGGSGIDRRGQAGERYRYVFENLPPANPIQVAEQIAIIDQVSNGRFIYGAGGNTIGDARRQRHFLEYLAVMKQAWTEDEFSGYHGEFYDYPRLEPAGRVSPKPVQKPYPQIVLPLDSQQSFVPMGRNGYWIAIGGGSSHNERGDAVLKQDVANYRQAWRDAGRTGDPKVVIRISTHVAATRAEANRTLEAVDKVHADHAAATGQQPRRTDGRERGSNLFGTPEEVVDRIQELHEAFGADEIMCMMMDYMLSREDVIRTMRLVADKVIPKVK
jgi:alkanesulfonate monooxygenase SsuD/methylene tetrahydromethanopterin reductase-like flavin-dependent oxidoreductase (luciferase family)